MTSLLHYLAAHWYAWIVPLSIQAAILILILAPIDRLLSRRAWPQLRYALWLLVLLKLLLPPTLATPTSLIAPLWQVVPPVTTRTFPPMGEMSAYSRTEGVPAYSNDAPIASQPKGNTAWQGGDTHPIHPITNSPPGVPQPKGSPAARSGGSSNPAATRYPPATTRTSPPMGEMSAKRTEGVPANEREPRSPVFLFLIWTTGVLILSTWLARQYLALRRHTRRPVDPAAQLPNWFHDVLTQAAADLKLRRLPRVVPTDRVASPAVFGLLRPTLLVPADSLERLTRREAEHFLLHELAHLKRRDLHVHALTLVLQVLYWFHPLLWLVRRHLHHLRELCCDATVARLLRERTPAYRETLLETARRLLDRNTEPGLGLLGLFESPNRLLTRLQWLEKPTWKHPRLRIATTIAAITLMLACILPMAAGNPENNPTTKPPTDAPQDTPDPEPNTPEHEPTTNNFTATLPNGVTVELVSVRKHDYPLPAPSESQWWRPNGKPLDTPPYAKPGWSTAGGRPMWEFAVHVTGPDQCSYAAGTHERIDTARVDQKPPTNSDDESINNLRVFIADFPNGTTSGDLLFGAACGPWETVQEWTGNEWEKDKLDVTSMISDAPVVFTWPRDYNNGFVVTVTHPFINETRRLVLIDKDGNSHVEGHGTIGEGEGIERNTFTFWNIKRENIAKFVFQKRPYQWAIFKNVSLQPGHRTTVEIDLSLPTAPKPRADAASSAKYSPDQVADQPASFFFDRIGDAGPGYHHFAPLWALIDKGKAASPQQLREITRQAAAIIADQSQSPFRRWQSCYVISGIGDPNGIPALREALLHDPGTTVRGCAACALGAFEHAPAIAALQHAQTTETNPEVLSWIERNLKGEFRKHPAPPEKTPERSNFTATLPNGDQVEFGQGESARVSAPSRDLDEIDPYRREELAASTARLRALGQTFHAFHAQHDAVPTTLEQLQPHISDPAIHETILTTVEYFPPPQIAPDAHLEDIPIAYDRSLLPTSRTLVLFLDGHVAKYTTRELYNLLAGSPPAVTLPNGVQATLLAFFAGSDPDNVTWWRPDGSPLPPGLARALATMYDAYASQPMTEGDFIYGYFVNFASADEDSWTARLTPPKGTVEPIFMLPDGLRCTRVLKDPVSPSMPPAGDLTVVASTGQYQQFQAEVQMGNVTLPDGEKVRRPMILEHKTFPDGAKMFFTTLSADPLNEELKLYFSYNRPFLDIRPLSYTLKTGRTRENARIARWDRFNLDSTFSGTFLIPAPIEELRSVTLPYRPVDLAIFKNVSLQPGNRTSVKTELIAPANESSPEPPSAEMLEDLTTRAWELFDKGRQLPMPEKEIQLNQAMALYVQLYHAQPDKRETACNALTMIAMCHNHLGNTAEQIPVLETAVEKFPDYSAANWFYLGNAYRDANQKQKAIHAYQRSLQLANPSKFPAKDAAAELRKLQSPSNTNDPNLPTNNFTFALPNGVNLTYLGFSELEGTQLKWHAPTGRQFDLPSVPAADIKSQGTVLAFRINATEPAGKVVMDGDIYQDTPRPEPDLYLVPLTERRDRVNLFQSITRYDPSSDQPHLAQFFFLNLTLKPGQPLQAAYTDPPPQCPDPNATTITFRLAAEQSSPPPPPTAQPATEPNFTFPLPNGVNLTYLGFSELEGAQLKWHAPTGQQIEIPNIYPADIDGQGTTLAFRAQFTRPANELLIQPHLAQGPRRELLKRAFWQVRDSDVYLVSLKEDRRFANLLLHVFRYKASHQTPPIAIENPDHFVSQEPPRNLVLPPEVRAALPDNVDILAITLTTKSNEKWTGEQREFDMGVPLPPYDFPLKDVTTAVVTHRPRFAEEALLDLRNMIFWSGQHLEAAVETIESTTLDVAAQPIPATIVTFTPAEQSGQPRGGADN